VSASSGERHGERHEAKNSHHHASQVPPAKPPIGHARRHNAEHADLSSRDALHEREQSQPQRRRVEEKSAGLHREAKSPAAARE
jgi:hypothetical protein